MAAVAFPALVPSGRRYNPGRYPQAEFKALNGATTTLRYGNRRFDAELDLQFQNVTDTQAAQLLALYEQTMVADDWVTFTAADGAGGASTPLANYIREVGGSGLRWRFSEPPSVDSVKPGLSTVAVRFIGRLDPT
ncbi:MAG: hypothetical protein ACO23G_12775 [Limnohabitans sp.]